MTAALTLSAVRTCPYQVQALCNRAEALSGFPVGPVTYSAGSLAVVAVAR